MSPGIPSQSVDGEPAAEIVLDAVNIRGLAHPLRVRMLGVLRERGPATATSLAEALGESTGSTSYHLRQLAEYGFVIDAPGLGKGRERWWQAAHRMTSFDFSENADTDTEMLGIEYLQGVATYNCAAIASWVGHVAQQPQQWRDAGTMSDWLLRLTPSRSRELAAELSAIVERFQQESASGQESGSGAAVGAPPAAEVATVVVQFQVLPKPDHPLES